jgi:hypothetical protein
MLWWIVNFLSAGAFRDCKTIEDVFNLRPADEEDFRKIEWADDVLNQAVFPEWSVDGKKEKVKSHAAWAKDVSDWGQRANILGLTVHCIRREILINVTGKLSPFKCQKSC